MREDIHDKNARARGYDLGVRGLAYRDAMSIIPKANQAAFLRGYAKGCKELVEKQKREQEAAK